ncbi:hypothetical protein C8Q75DRAFT_809464 [Abortiporus biennis]|nr:hypothetical protein C8Q75DRAFT_809464 [Abortiporus biennis]
MSKGGLFLLLGVTSPFDTPNAFITSPLFSPLVLALIRLTFAVYGLVVVITVLAWDGHSAGSDFSFFTELSYIGLLSYFWAAGVQTLVYALTPRRSYPLQNWPRVLQFLHVLLYSTITTFPILVTIVFWSLLSSSSTFATKFEAWDNISRHALNTVFALFEILFTNMTPMPWLHLPLLIIMLAGYLGVAYITQKTQGFYTYNFLDPHKQHGLLAAYLVGIAAATCVVFTIVRCVIVLRQYLVSRYSIGGQGGPSTPEAIDEWEEIEHPQSSDSSDRV